MIIIEGRIERDIYGSWSDCSPGLYIGSEHESMLINEIYKFTGRNVRITIEEIDDDNESE